MRINIHEIGWVIRERRETLRITQEQLAEFSEVSKRTIQNIENGTGNPTLDVLEKILNTLGLKMEINVG